MSTKITINNFLAIGQADIQLAPSITMISGTNGSGKTSIMSALYCLLAGDTIPRHHMKKNVGELVKRGAGTAYISIEDETGMYSVDYPKMSASDAGFRFISSHSADIRHGNIIDMTPAGRAREMISILGANPTKEELREALNFVDDKQFSDIYRNLELLGWDTIADNMTEKAKQSKTLWARVTGEPYGSSKAANWIPANWSSDIDGKDLQELEADVATSAHLVESAVGMSAISEAEYIGFKTLVENHKTIVAEYEPVEEKHAEYRAKIDSINKDIAIADSEYSKLLAKPTEYTCPCCNRALILSKGVLVEAGESDVTADKEALAAKIKLLREDVKSARDFALEKLYADKLQELKKAEHAIEKVREYKPDTDNSLQVAREFHTRNVSNLEAYRKRSEARLHADNVSHYLNISEVMKPTGIRAKKLKGKHIQFSDMLSDMFPAWQITCDSDFTPLVNGFYRLSDAQTWMSKVAYMVVVAKLRGDRIVVIDEIEALDRATKTSALKYLYKSGLQVVIANACTGDKDNIDISKIPNCKKYRITNGTVTEVFGEN